jgi:arsenate reductase
MASGWRSDEKTRTTVTAGSQPRPFEDGDRGRGQRMDLNFVFTVCDQAASEACPVWPSQPMTAHWGVEDPAAFVGPPEAQLRVFQRVYMELDNRIRIFTSLRLEELDKLALKRRLDEIGGVRLPEAEAS